MLGGAAALAVGAGATRGFAQAKTVVTTALGWVPNVEYAGLWLAIEKGYFARENIEAKFIPGGPNAPDTLVSLATGAADVAGANWLPILDSVAKGNDFVIIGATWAKSPAAVCSMARHPVQEPKDLAGATILAQNPTDKQIIDAILGGAGLPLDYEIKPTGFSPEPLIAGDGDAYLCFATNQPITLERMGLVEGRDFFVTLLDDLGYRVLQGLLVVPRSLIAGKRDAVTGYLRALVRGWTDHIKDPGAAARLVVDKYGADLGLDIDQQIRQAELEVPLLEGDEKSRGLLWFDPAIVTGAMTRAAHAAGRSVPELSKIVDLGPLEEALKTL
ncbi:ABC transporter substrate-binding protein [Faunimonas pinastri]|nr:ABC transporter substrate-binding protein [Faunimonas pinastri]